MRELDLNADRLVSSLLGLAGERPVSILDSCGVGHLNSHMLIAGIDPIDEFEFSGTADSSISKLEKALSGDSAAFFTLGYDLGRKLQGLPTRHRPSGEPDLYVALFDAAVVHDYARGKTFMAGNPAKFDEVVSKLTSAGFDDDPALRAASVRSDSTRDAYIAAVEKIRERIRRGDTYQTNLTRQISVSLPEGLSGRSVFHRLRSRHPAPFSAFIERPGSTVVSASPERFFRIEDGRISASPIKGTRPRSSDPETDSALRDELLNSAKDRAENVMIVDLLRNDLGRVCTFGTVRVESLCEIEVLPSLYHMVSTIAGELRPGVRFGEILTALFPCGSITGAPKISTMHIIDEIESAPRGLSMGAIGYRLPASFGLGETIDLSVAIRTLVVRDGEAVFNVGGGIVIDSDAADEYDETVTKSRALLESLGIEL